MNFIEELRWRGLIHDITPGLEEHLCQGKMVRGYIGFDPTAPALTIGNYLQIMLLQLFQRCGHQPVVLLGGATGRIGDPSGKDKERDLKSAEELESNLRQQTRQFKQLLDFSPRLPNRALIVNNFDFYKKMSVLDFLRDVGKYQTVNVMLSRESVRRRMESESGISFTEFSYQLLQGYDFVLLRRQWGITVQMGGSDQFGNIVTGVELNRKIDDAKVYSVTTPLLTKADGTKFGKSEQGNIWLDPRLTSPYRFYQFWLNCDDRDLPKLLRSFSLKNREEIEYLEAHESPQQVKRALAEEMSVRLHGKKEFETVMSVSRLLFDPQSNPILLRQLSLKTLQQVADEIPSPKIQRSVLAGGTGILDFLSEQTNILSSKTEARNAIKNHAISINKQKIASAESQISTSDLLHNRFLMVENGRKNKFLVEVLD